MNKLFTSTLLTVVAVPFLLAAPSAAKKVQNQVPTSTDSQSTMAKTKTKKHVKKVKKTSGMDSAPATATTHVQK